MQTLSLYLLFALTGVGLVLPGTLLPFLVRGSDLHDAGSGGLFLLFFIGTTAGAFCARGRLGRMLLLSTAAVAVPISVLTKLHGVAISGAVLLSGFGLGLMMTAVTLLRSRQVPDRRATELTRLNLVWAIGAACAPFLLLRSTAQLGVAATLQAYAVAVLLCGTPAALSLWHEHVPLEGQWAAWRQLRSIKTVSAIALPLTTGIEAGVGAWLVTYALRDRVTYGMIVTAGTALWAGLLLSRVVFSVRWLRLGQGRYTAAAFAALLVCGLLMLLWAGSAGMLIAGAFCCGFGVGPIYPELLARSLAGSEAGNAAFLLAGLGSALLPFLIGQVSQAAHSLRAGLFVPLAGAAVLLVGLLCARESAVANTTG
ncbi:MFS transporter [Terriglobus aquaticus]|uniref:MFS transporter n=1 Tax=Terriglobus aquaticus TaxID=940139 RepID=A0ABW9KI39_9BACT